MDYDVIVVGAGISGLLSSLALSKEGKKVLVLERNGFVGGNVRTYDVDGYKVDTGPHAITHLGDGPLTALMDDYFDVLPYFVPYGNYHVRTKNRFKQFPWTAKDWVNFSILPKRDRLQITHVIAAVLAYSTFGGVDMGRDVYDFLKDYNLSEKTWRFVDALCYFMSGKSMKEVPAWRVLKGVRYIEEEKGRHMGDIFLGNVSKFIKLVRYDGTRGQAYPRHGLGSITDSVLYSLPKKKVKINLNENVNRLMVKDNRVRGVRTDKDNYSARFVVYSGFVTDLPGLMPNALQRHYINKLDTLERTNSMTIWLGLNKKLPQFDYVGSEIWFEEGKPFWAMPTSNYNENFAPRGHQLVGFASYMEDDAKKEEKALMETITLAIPEIDKHVDMKHTQLTYTEKAAITTKSKFPPVKSPVDNLYLVGTDVDTRSMGITRASFSVLKLLETLRRDRLL